jgi:hypothetical protein
MKTKLSILLALMIIISLLSGCGFESSTSPRVSMNPSGTAAATWIDEASNLFLNRFFPETGWEGTQKVVQVGSVFQSEFGPQPQTAVDNFGNTMLVWVEEGYMMAGYFPADPSIEYTVEQISNNILEPEEYEEVDLPQIAIDPSGNAFVVWMQFKSFDGLPMFSIWTNRFDADKQEWEGPVCLQDYPIIPEEEPEPGFELDFHFAPKIVTGPTGDAMAVWNVYNISQALFTMEETDEYPYLSSKILAKRYVVSSGWDENPEIVYSTEKYVLPIASTKSSVKSLMSSIIEQSKSVKSSGKVTNLTVLENLKSLKSVKSSGDIIFVVLVDHLISMDSSGNATLVWTELQLAETEDSSEESIIIQTKRYEANEGWSEEPEILNADKNIAIYLPQLTVNPSGSAFVVWIDKIEEEIEEELTLFEKIMVCHYELVKGWSQPVHLFITDSSESLKYPNVAVDETGNAIAVWVRSKSKVEEYSKIEDSEPDYIWGSRYLNGKGWSEPDKVENTNASGEKRYPKIKMDYYGNAVLLWEHNLEIDKGDGITEIWSNTFN